MIEDVPGKNKQTVTNNYDKHYRTENLFGAPYPELIALFKGLPSKGKVLDMGCGQGRDAIALARLGYSVTGIDTSQRGIDQMLRTAKAEKLPLAGYVSDIYTFDDLHEFDIILLDSMFHFTRKDKEMEIELIRKIISKIKDGALLVICIQDTADKVAILTREVPVDAKQLLWKVDKSFTYTFRDEESGHSSETKYRMLVLEKWGSNEK